MRWTGFERAETFVSGEVTVGLTCWRRELLEESLEVCVGLCAKAIRGEQRSGDLLRAAAAASRSPVARGRQKGGRARKRRRAPLLLLRRPAALLLENGARAVEDVWRENQREIVRVHRAAAGRFSEGRVALSLSLRLVNPLQDAHRVGHVRELLGGQLSAEALDRFVERAILRRLGGALEERDLEFAREQRLGQLAEALFEHTGCILRRELRTAEL